MSTQIISVSDSAGLLAALSQARGGEVVELAGGNYGDFGLWNVTQPFAQYASTVTIRSADPENPASFSKIAMTGVSNLTFDAVKFDYDFQDGDPIYYKPFKFSSCTNITITNSKFDGDYAENVSAEADGYGYAQGLVINNCKGVTIQGNEFENFHRGLVVTESQNVVVADNNVHSMRSDGMDFNQVDGVVIERNWFHDFTLAPGSGDHPDMIQFWTTGTTAPSQNIVIRGNLMDIGEGAATQSIFMRNELVDRGQAGSEMFYRNVLIEDNTIFNAQLNGIVVGATEGLTIRWNSVLHADGGNVDGADSTVEIPRIEVASASVLVEIVKNLTSAISGFSGQSGWVILDNVMVQDQSTLKAGYYGTMFVGSTLDVENGQTHYLVLEGSLIDLLDAGSSYIRTSGTGLEPLFHVTEANRATRVFDAGFSLADGQHLPDGTTFLWDFGDGTVAEGMKVAHSYTTAGDYSVALKVMLPDGSFALEKTVVAVEGAHLLSMDSANGIIAYDRDTAIALGQPAAMTSEGLQLGASGVVASVGRQYVADVVAEDDFFMSFSLDADKVGATGEVFRLHGSFIASVLSSGELQFLLLQDGQSSTKLLTSGAKLNAVADQDHDLAISLDDGKLQIWVDGTLNAETSFHGVVGGASGFSSHNLVFGNPWGQVNFNGDLDHFDFSVSTGDFPSDPVAPDPLPSGTDAAMSSEPDDGSLASEQIGYVNSPYVDEPGVNELLL
ncbi:right-handed parallel beta-helix repeat-containing protein [Rubellimicrobium arenae]|uniref:right-handed parallel beta-helix repeat-containing protein n=1 Tax=Rubellimicrobium arenae TaxID=2817372 RepID=UPI001B3163ED|nr:right-handed parallel beta-helix repeat-containing protein [Rubellimicrobium arenae]